MFENLYFFIYKWCSKVSNWYTEFGFWLDDSPFVQTIKIWFINQFNWFNNTAFVNNAKIWTANQFNWLNDSRFIQIISKSVQEWLGVLKEEGQETVKNLLGNFWPYLQVMLCHIGVFLLFYTKKAFAILFLLKNTVLPVVVILLLFCVILDRLGDLLNRIKAYLEAEGWDFPQKPAILNRIPVADHPLFPITFWDRGLAILAYSWPMALANSYFSAALDYAHPWLIVLHYYYLQGLVILVSLNKAAPIILYAFILHGVARRIGPDTQWILAPYTTWLWLKHFVRYHWCFSLCIIVIEHLTTVVYNKFVTYGYAAGEAAKINEQASLFLTEFLYTLFLIMCSYGVVCAILGTQPRFPITHRACILHCGRLRLPND